MMMTTEANAIDGPNVVQVSNYYLKSQIPLIKPQTRHLLLAPANLPPAPVYLPIRPEKRKLGYKYMRACLPKREGCVQEFYEIVEDLSPKKQRAGTIRFAVHENGDSKLVLYLLDFFHFETASAELIYCHVPDVFKNETGIFINYLDAFAMHDSADGVCEEIEQVLNFYRRPTCIIGQGTGAAIGRHLATRTGNRFISINEFDIESLRRSGGEVNTAEKVCSSEDIETMVKLANQQVEQYWSLESESGALDDALVGRVKLTAELLREFVTELTCFEDPQIYRRQMSKSAVRTIGRALSCLYSPVSESASRGLYIYSFHSPFINESKLKGRDDVCYVPFCGHDVMVEAFDVIRSILTGK